jgi:osmotically-inducible protein OsmY
MDTAALAEELTAALEREARVDLQRDRIAIEFDDGVATLSGEVADIGAKRLALEHAAALPAVTGIVDRLHVRPSEPRDDEAIAEEVERSLLHDSAFDQVAIHRRVGDQRTVVREASAEGRLWWIEVQVQDGLVTLDGDVSSLSHKRFAGALAWWVPGVRDVINGLGIEPDEADSDDEILDALRLVLDKDPLVDPTQIHATCASSVITLEGFVAKGSYRAAAERDAWSLFGVDRVVNRIEVMHA